MPATTTTFGTPTAKRTIKYKAHGKAVHSQPLQVSANPLSATAIKQYRPEDAYAAIVETVWTVTFTTHIEGGQSKQHTATTGVEQSQTFYFDGEFLTRNDIAQQRNRGALLDKIDRAGYKSDELLVIDRDGEVRRYVEGKHRRITL